MTNGSSADPDQTPTVISRVGPVIGVLGTIAMCVQNAGFATGVGWALIHGAGPLALLGFVPLAVGVALLWAGFVYLRRQQGRGGLLLFAGYATVLLLLNEALLPATPLRARLSERALMSGGVLSIHDEEVPTATGGPIGGASRSAGVLSIRDEAVMTAAGDPIGVRLVFEVRFPQRVVANISASAFGLSEKEPPWLNGRLDFRLYQLTIKPSPQAEDIYKVFEKDVVYRIEDIRTIGFRTVDYRTGRPCRDKLPDMSDDQIVAALRRRGNRRYTVDIQASSPDVGVSMVLATYQTSRPYDLEAMYRTVVAEGLEPCRP